MKDLKKTRKELNATTSGHKPQVPRGSKTQVRPRLPDPKFPGSYRPFTSDPGWDEAWWWLGLPVLYGLFVIVSFQASPQWYEDWVIAEGHGVIEVTHFLLPLFGFVIAGGLLFQPFVRARPFVFTVGLIGALSCLYIAGEEMSWGQHFFHWNTPEYWAAVNRQGETNLHNTYYIFDKLPRNLLGLAVLIGGLFVPVAAAFNPRVRANRISLFLPAAALVPTALCAMAFALIDLVHWRDLIQRPSEIIETYFYFFILAYLILYARRIRELEAEGRSVPQRGSIPYRVGRP